jgi:16S rRNA (uracil1498-N3)-methyltransferase
VRHVPHLFLEPPWAGVELTLSPDQASHLTRVLRLGDGDPVSYTDGQGIVGEGHLGSGLVVRGGESTVPRPSDLVLVVAPPDNRDRARFLVEKLAEMGVEELVFLDARLGEGRPPRTDRLRAWAVSALEQSRGAWLMRTGDGLVTFPSISRPFLVCEPGASRETPRARTVVVGPEGGWAPGEVPEDAPRLGLGDTILRVETAAVVAAARML